MRRFKKIPTFVYSDTSVGDSILEGKNPRELRFYYYNKVDREQYPSFYSWIKALRLFELPRDIESATELSHRDKPDWYKRGNDPRDPIGAPALPMNYYTICYVDYYGAETTAENIMGWDEAEAVDNLDIELKQDDRRNGVAEVITIEETDSDEARWARQREEEDTKWRDEVNTYRARDNAPSDADYDADLDMFTHPEDPDLLWDRESNGYNLRWDYNKGIIKASTAVTASFDAYDSNDSVMKTCGDVNTMLQFINSHEDVATIVLYDEDDNPVDEFSRQGFIDTYGGER